MVKKRDKQRSDKLFLNLEKMSAYGAEIDGADENTAGVLSIQGQAVLPYADSSKLPRLKRFRFQLLHQWLIHQLQPCRAADIGGGKGLLGYLLKTSGWDVTVIDPAKQALPDKYRDLTTSARVRIDPAETIPHIQAEFQPEHAAGFDLLIGMHAHGCNVKIIDAAADYGCGFVIFPCCVIGEPFYPPLGVHWLESLADYALRRGHAVQPFRLNFKGQNIGLYNKKK